MPDVLEDLVKCVCKSCGDEFEVARFTGEKTQAVKRKHCTPCERSLKRVKHREVVRV